MQLLRAAQIIVAPTAGGAAADPIDAAGALDERRAALIFAWSRLSEPPPAPVSRAAKKGAAAPPVPPPGLTLFDMAEGLARLADEFCPAADVQAIDSFLSASSAGSGADGSGATAAADSGASIAPAGDRSVHPLVRFWRQGGNAATDVLRSSEDGEGTPEPGAEQQQHRRALVKGSSMAASRHLGPAGGMSMAIRVGSKTAAGAAAGPGMSRALSRAVSTVAPRAGSFAAAAAPSSGLSRCGLAGVGGWS